MSSKDRSIYSSNLESLLTQRTDALTVSECRITCGCDSSSCRDSIQAEYNEIRAAMLAAAQSLPRSSAGEEKDWWTPTLTELRDQNITIQNIWRETHNGVGIL